MRKLGLILLLAALAALVAAGCSEEENSKPYVSRLYASETCGVAPLRVDFRADATGGKPFNDPTGGNNWLRMSWDFGDGTVIANGTSIAYHRYEAPGIFTVTVTAEDDAGERDSRSMQVKVNADSLSIEVFGTLHGEIVTELKACEPLTLGIIAETCGFDPVSDTYDRFIYRWSVAGAAYTSANPQHAFAPATEPRVEMITLNLIDPTRSTTRNDTLWVDVLPSAGADLSLAAFWLLPDSLYTTSDTLRVTLPGVWPNTFTYRLHARNAGPEPAYHVTVRGNQPNLANLHYVGAFASSGGVTYDSASDARRWTWQIPAIAAGGEETVFVAYRIESPPPSNNAFPIRMQPYACDPDTTNLQITPRLITQTFR